MNDIFDLNFTKVAAVVVLYNPDNNVYENIMSYVDQVEAVYVVDNSDMEVNWLSEIKFQEKIKYLSNGCNLGIARALNIGAEWAIRDGYDYLLTCDQDSTASDGMVDALLRCIDPLEVSKIAIVSPFHLTDIDTIPCGNPSWEEVLTAWTSGNLLNLDIYRTVGPFRDDFFIDFVDHEYCLRLQSLKFRVLRSNQAVLKHCIGTDLKKNKLFHLTFISSNHSCVRKYYITRNRFCVRKLYQHRFPDFFKDDKRKFIADLINILFFEKNRIRKYYMIYLGYRDFLRGKMGYFYS